MKIVFWHVIDDGKDALVTLGRLLARYGEKAKYLRGEERRPREGLHAVRCSRTTRAEAERLGAAILELPELNPAVMQKIDRWDASFWAAVHGTTAPETFSRIERQRVKVWLAERFDQIAKLGDLF